MSRSFVLDENVVILAQALLNNSAKENHFLSEGEYPHLPELESLPGVDEGEREFVRAAASVYQSVFATTDGPCRLALISNAIDEKYQFVVATPAEALAMAGPSDP